MRHQESGVNSRFTYGDMSFEKYIKHIQTIILKYRVDVQPENRDRILNANSPFELKPDLVSCKLSKEGNPKRGILLIHGLSDSPYMMRDLATYFQSKCFLVRGILLPGHGTVPGDLLQVTFQEWLKATRFGIKGLAKKVRQVYVAGFSTGGALGIHEGLKGTGIDGLLLFSPAIELRTNVGVLANWHKTVSWAKKDLKWVDVAKDLDYAKYESFTKNAADQIHLLTKEIDSLNGHGNRLNMPVFMAVSLDDATVDTQAAVEFLLAQPNPNNRVVAYTNDVTVKSRDPRLIHVDAKFPPMNVRELSHLSLTLSPDDPHYGLHGDYKNCGHYFLDIPRFKRCKSDSSLPYGEIRRDSRSEEIFRRLTFNPFFAELKQEMDKFIKKLP